MSENIRKALSEIKDNLWHAANELIIMQQSPIINREMMKSRIDQIFKEISKL